MGAKRRSTVTLNRIKEEERHCSGGPSSGRGRGYFRFSAPRAAGEEPNFRAAGSDGSESREQLTPGGVRGPVAYGLVSRVACERQGATLLILKVARALARHSGFGEGDPDNEKDHEGGLQAWFQENFERLNAWHFRFAFVVTAFWGGANRGPRSVRIVGAITADGRFL